MFGKFRDVYKAVLTYCAEKSILILQITQRKIPEDKIRNEEFRRINQGYCRLRPKLRWAGHVPRMQNIQPTKVILEWRQ